MCTLISLNVQTASWYPTSLSSYCSTSFWSAPPSVGTSLSLLISYSLLLLNSLIWYFLCISHSSKTHSVLGKDTKTQDCWLPPPSWAELIHLYLLNSWRLTRAVPAPHPPPDIYYLIEKPFIPETNEFTKHNDTIFAGHLYFKRKEKRTLSLCFLLGVLQFRVLRLSLIHFELIFVSAVR